MQLAVCGLHMRGQKLEHQLTSLQASFLTACRSAPAYKLFAITDPANGICKPGMVYVGQGRGKAIDLEVWTLPVQNLGSFFSQISAPLGLGTVALEDGSSVKGFICEGYIADLGKPVNNADGNALNSNLLVEDITGHGSWRQFQAQIQSLRTKAKD